MFKKLGFFMIFIVFFVFIFVSFSSAKVLYSVGLVTSSNSDSGTTSSTLSKTNNNDKFYYVYYDTKNKEYKIVDDTKDLPFKYDENSYMPNYGGKFKDLDDAKLIVEYNAILGVTPTTKVHSGEIEGLNPNFISSKSQIINQLNNPDNLNLDQINVMVKYLPELSKIDNTVPEKIIGDLFSKKKELEDYEDSKEYQSLSDKEKEKKSEEIQKQIDQINNKILPSLPKEALVNYAVTHSDNKEEVIDMLQKNECGDGWIGSICKAFNFKSDLDYYSEVLDSKISNLDKQYSPEVVSFSGKKESVKDVADLKYNQELETMYNNKLSTIAKEFIQLQGLKENPTIVKDYVKNLKNGEYVDAMVSTCKNKDACEDLVRRAQILKMKVEENTYIKPSAYTFTISSLLNPDRVSIQAARAAGFEPDFTRVPSWLRSSIPSQICLAKIDGYLDKDLNGATVESDVMGVSGLTSYTSCVDNTDPANPQSTVQCIKVKSDLRAQRTMITPNNHTIITYSVYVANTGSKMNYKITLFYKKSGNLENSVLENGSFEDKNLVKYNSVDFPINATEKEVKDFNLKLDVYYSGGAEYTSLEVPVVLINFSNIPNPFSGTLEEDLFKGSYTNDLEETYQ
jgi:chaperonin cofactor prefoldin